MKALSIFMFVAGLATLVCSLAYLLWIASWATATVDSINLANRYLLRVVIVDVIAVMVAFKGIAFYPISDDPQEKA